MNKVLLKKIGRGILAGLTSPEAIKAEKTIAMVVIVRLAIALGASAGIVDLISRFGGL